MLEHKLQAIVSLSFSNLFVASEIWGPNMTPKMSRHYQSYSENNPNPFRRTPNLNEFPCTSLVYGVAGASGLLTAALRPQTITPRRSHHEEHQRRSHHQHASHQAVRYHNIFGVITVSRWEQLEGTNHDHDTWASIGATCPFDSLLSATKLKYRPRYLRPCQRGCHRSCRSCLRHCLQRFPRQ